MRGYIPSNRLLKEGGYGGGEEIHYFGLPSKFEQKIEKNEDIFGRGYKIKRNQKFNKKF